MDGDRGAVVRRGMFAHRSVGCLPPLHEAFWQAIAAGMQPAKALFQAKAEYARQIPHGQTDAFSRAVELKILRQFTCLGLGW